MKKAEKIFEVEDVKAKIKDAKAIAVTDYRGLTVSQATKLRRSVRESGGNLQVIKNTLMLRALRENGYKVEREKLDGPTMVLFANDDEVSPIKALATFAKTIEGSLPWKIGFMAGKVLSKEELKTFASLPPKIQLQAKLVGVLFSQPSRLAYALNYNLQKLVIALNQVKNKKGGEN